MNSFYLLLILGCFSLTNCVNYNESLMFVNRTYGSLIYPLSTDSTNLDKCTEQILISMTMCLDDVSESWDIKNKSTFEGESIRTKCCATWDFNDCIVNQAFSVCGKTKMKEWKENLTMVNRCADYPYGSAKCHFPLWGIFLIIIGGLVVLGVVVFLINRIYPR